MKSDKTIAKQMTFSRHTSIKANSQVGVKLTTTLQTSFIRPRAVVPKNALASNYLQIVEEVTNSGVPNYKGCKIQLLSCFNLSYWQDKLRQYEDKEVVNLMRFGFPLGLTNHSNLHRSKVRTIQQPGVFQRTLKYIIKEQEHRVSLGLFQDVPHKCFHCSPMLTGPKEGSSRRVIVDVSYGDMLLVNGNTYKDSYEGRDFDLQLPSIDHLIEKILSMNDPMLGKADVAHGPKRCN